MSKPSGLILYRGPSLLDGAPIVVVATGLGRSSRNEKTGDMVQTWIIRDDVRPDHAAKSGDDASVCGDCPHRPVNAGSCYVKTFQAPLSVWNAVHRGVYPTADDAGAVSDAGAGRMVRLGSYGDPAAVPVWVWEALTARAKGWTGYTHQWRVAPALKALCMASVDDFAEAVTARAQGWRTFRVRTAGEALEPREFICPASAEAGQKTDCASCRACMGTDAKAKASPVIVAHGATARRFALYRQGTLVPAIAA
ncbi:hypothetical protein [Caulobacter vibrioides]|uniref:Uncharacterized protein n=1 Tax=Caulobacter phage S2B TaxID=2759120 RepID=A0AAE7SYL7_9CAUD|nr:hypothetical protein [Caulobacter vibrioides]QOC54178.1 hypothetical protein [Caulobacter phage S2B]QXZ50206.1 hypothetical protein KZH45_09745 [Caulobacter vibrioides]